MSLDRKYYLLSARNTEVFPKVQGTPEFSSYIADLSFSRLTQDMREKKNNIWDPYCGNGVILRTIAVLHRPLINQLFASDIRPEASKQTAINIATCSTFMYKKRDEFKRLLQRHNCNDQIPVTAFTHDVISSNNNIISDDTIDILVTDPPYEEMESYFEQTPPVNEGTVSDYLPLLLSSVRRKMKDQARIGLVLDPGDDYEEVLTECDGYQFKNKGQIDTAYKNRILYTLTTN